ncbi:hypothetical protein [Nitrosophilus kaiyonis]|uniref:hypothetical protein n=1 Tax=Nitrosophilus kaiyonis TaxID=2930200 RepID=UPI00249200B6|nr:hypothetical protein [Nitrosophilus kaiyonis]
MGGYRIKSLKKIIDEIIISIKNDQFESLEKFQKDLNSIDLNSLTNEEKNFLINAIIEIEKIVTDKKNSILKSISDKENLKKFI